MSRKEDIDNGIWSDPDFEDLSAYATLLYLWSFTNPRCGMAGIYKVSRRAMAESKVPAEWLDESLSELSTAGFLFYERGVMFIRTRVKHLRQKTEQIAKSIASDLRKLDDTHPLKAKFVEEYGADSWLSNVLDGEGRMTVAGPSVGGQAVGSLEPKVRSSVEGHPTLKGNGNGKGPGKGKGKGLEDSRARAQRARAWAAENLPDLPADFVAQVYSTMPGAPSPDHVRECVLAAYPSLREDAA